MAKKGLPRIIGTSLSVSKSNTMKSIRKMKLSILTNTSSILPLEYAWDLSASCDVIISGMTSPTPNCLNTDNGIRLKLAPKSQNALPLYLVPMEQEIVKLPGFFNFWGILLYSIWLHSCVKAIVLNSPRLISLPIYLLKNLYNLTFVLVLPQKKYWYAVVSIHLRICWTACLAFTSKIFMGRAVDV